MRHLLCLQFNYAGESQTLVVTRPVRTPEHDLGTLWPGDRVFVRRNEEGEGYHLADEASGAPTNGNQYLEFADVDSAQAFARRVGLTALEEE